MKKSHLLILTAVFAILHGSVRWKAAFPEEKAGKDKIKVYSVEQNGFLNIGASISI